MFWNNKKKFLSTETISSVGRFIKSQNNWQENWNALWWRGSKSSGKQHLHGSCHARSNIKETNWHCSADSLTRATQKTCSTYNLKCCEFNALLAYIAWCLFCFLFWQRYWSLQEQINISGNLSGSVHGNHVSRLKAGRVRLSYIKLLNRKRWSVEPEQHLPSAKVCPIKFHRFHFFLVLACSHPKGVWSVSEDQRKVWLQDCHCLAKQTVSRIGPVSFYLSIFFASASRSHGSCSILTVKLALKNSQQKFWQITGACSLTGWLLIKFFFNTPGNLPELVWINVTVSIFLVKCWIFTFDLNDTERTCWCLEWTVICSTIKSKFFVPL